MIDTFNSVNQNPFWLAAFWGQTSMVNYISTTNTTTIATTISATTTAEMATAATTTGI